LESNLIQEAKFELEEDDDYDPKYVAEYVNKTADSWDEAAKQIVLPLTAMPAYNEKTIALGEKAFLDTKLGCAKCHGPDGKGGKRPGVTADEVPKDDWGQVAYAADLTSGMLHGGRRPIDIYRRIYSGINGTPMPGFSEALKAKPETVWHLAQFVTSVVEGREVQGNSVNDE
jgi:mono/diheme cytochrome c family protein